MKKCGKCGLVKPVDQFLKRKGTPCGRRSQCKACHSSYVSTWNKDHRDDKREYERTLRQSNPEITRAKNLRRFYDLSISEFEALWESQNGLCLICVKPLEFGSNKYGIDHDHSCCPGKRSCGKCIRGLLCAHCNKGLGFFRDNPDLLRAGADYIEQHRGRVA